MAQSQALYNWVQKFSEGWTRIKGEHRISRPTEIASDVNVQWVGDLVRADRRVTIDTIVTAIGCSHGMAYLIMHDRFGFHKVCARWVPRMLTPQHKMQRMGLALQHLNRYHDEGHDMLARIVTGDDVHPMCTDFVKT